LKTGIAGEDVGHEPGGLTIPKVTVEANEGLAASNARRLFSEKHATYARFIAFVHYPQGLGAFFRRSSLLRSGIRVLDAGCGTGAATLAVHDALVERAVTPGCLDAFDLTPAMLERFRKTLKRLGITLVEVRQANVLEMDTLPTAWTNYDLIVTASMLEYLPRERLSEALAALGKRLNESGRLVVFITRRNWLTRLLIGWWWESNLYHKDELLAEFERAGFSQVKFRPFPLTVRYLAAWGYVVEAWD
jgi:SAM-dependent methyltransferase